MSILIVFRYIDIYIEREFYVKLHLPWYLPLSSGGGGGTFRENLWGGVVVHRGTNDQIMPKEGSIINAFFNNLNTVNFFCNHLGMFT